MSISAHLPHCLRQDLQVIDSYARLADQQASRTYPVSTSCLPVVALGYTLPYPALCGVWETRFWSSILHVSILPIEPQPLPLYSFNFLCPLFIYVFKPIKHKFLLSVRKATSTRCEAQSSPHHLSFSGHGALVLLQIPASTCHCLLVLNLNFIVL